MARAGTSESLDQPKSQRESTRRGAAKATGKAKAESTKEHSSARAAEAKKPTGKATGKSTGKKPAKTKTAKMTKTADGAPSKAPAAAKGKKVAAAEKPAQASAKASAGAKAAAPGKKTAPDKREPAPAPASGFPAKTLEKLRRLLEEERETYLRQARDLAAEAEALASDREQGDTQFDEESGEGDTLNVERERDLALSASARAAVEDIDRALARMDAGTYGICERCGKKISVARLEALPYAALCIDCKSREERRR